MLKIVFNRRIINPTIMALVEGGGLHDVVINVRNYDIAVKEFEFQTHNYIHLKGMTPLSPSNRLLFFYKNGFSIK